MPIDIHIPGYEILEELGAGGMAKVYLGIQTSLDRKVAIKILHASLSMQSSEFKTRFLNEGRVLARVNHPNVVSIYDIAEVNGLLYMAMEYVPGGNLADRLKIEQLAVDETIQICAQVGLALHTTHLEHIVHRDLKPSNVLMRNGFQPILTDFGIARETDIESGLTQTGHIVGTMQYMSPEQIRGLTVDHRSDVYALGLLFYRLLTGRLPFVAKGHYDLSRMQCEDPPPPLPLQLQDFQAIIDVILAKDPADRFQTALDFCKALQSLDVTNEDYRTELTQQTRVYDSSRLSLEAHSFGSHPSLSSDSFSNEHSRRTSERYPSQGSERYSSRGSGHIPSRGSERYSSESSERFPSQGSGQFTQDASYGSQQFSTQQRRPATRFSWFRAALFVALPVLALTVAGLMYYRGILAPSTGLAEDDQKRVETYMRRAEGYYSTLIIDEPPEKNAVYYLNRVLEMAPEYKPALELAENIAEHYWVDAEDHIRGTEFDSAREDIAKGLALVPDHPRLEELNKEIQSKLEIMKKQDDIAEFLQLAISFQAQGFLIEPPGGNAFEQFHKVLELDDVNQTARQGLADIEKSLVDTIESLLNSGYMTTADSRLEEVQSRFPDSPNVTDLRNKINLQARLEREQQQVEQLLADARRQVSENNFIEPEGENALESYTRVLTLRSENTEAVQGLVEIATLYAQQAQDKLSQDDYQVAVELADNGMLATLDDTMFSDVRAQLSLVRDTALSQLGEFERETQALLQKAQEMVQTGKYIPPGENALETFRLVLERDPGNVQAQRALNILPRNILDHIERASVAGFLREAEKLASEAQSAYPDDSRFKEAKSKLTDLLARLNPHTPMTVGLKKRNRN